MAAAVARSDVGILWRQLVTPFAMSLLSVKPTPSIDIHLRRYWFKVLRVTTGSRTAKMIQLRPCWNSPAEELIAESMSVDIVAIDSDHSIHSVFSTWISAIQSSAPKPAARIWLKINLLLNALGQSAESNLVHDNPSMAGRLCWGQFF